MLRSLNSTAGAAAISLVFALAPVAATAASVTASGAAFSIAAVTSTTAAVSGGEQAVLELSELPADAFSATVVSLHLAAYGTSATLAFSINGTRQIAEVVFEGMQVGALAVGQTIKAISTEAGHVLMSDGRYLAFAPNDTGRQLLFSEALGK